MSVYLFTGPTLSPDEARRRLPDAVVLPPVSQGDVLRVARKRPSLIGIIDGYFESIPSVWHKEILWAMHEGIHVVGASSMGALRAAELEPFGMVGVGAIFERYRDGTYEDDDEVAVAHGPAADGFRAISVAMANIRATLEAAVVGGVLDGATAGALAALAKTRFYAERTWPALLGDATRAGIDVARLRAFLPRGQVDQKRLDALALLDDVAARRARGVEPLRVRFTFQHTDAWDTAVREAGELAATDGHVIDSEALADELRLEGADAYAQAEQGALMRFLTLSEARWQRVSPDAELCAAVRDAIVPGDPGAARSWLEAMDLTPAQLDALVASEACRAWVHDAARADYVHELADHLRLSGDYPRLAARAREKTRVLAAHGLDNPALADAGFADEAALDAWYFRERLGLDEIPDVELYARRVGAEDAAGLRRAVLRQRCYELHAGGGARLAVG